ncbi:hypothetical protein B0H11DRAFT_1060522 [Mycena galericulata]|nr:hypothetical protein B0H11DRAFT_1060522 [Mycena galericulata]
MGRAARTRYHPCTPLAWLQIFSVVPCVPTPTVFTLLKKKSDLGQRLQNVPALLIFLGLDWTIQCIYPIHHIDLLLLLFRIVSRILMPHFLAASHHHLHGISYARTHIYISHATVCTSWMDWERERDWMDILL